MKTFSELLEEFKDADHRNRRSPVRIQCTIQDGLYTKGQFVDALEGVFPRPLWPKTKSSKVGALRFEYDDTNFEPSELPEPSLSSEFLLRL